MNKVTVEHFAATTAYLYIIDDQDRLWSKNLQPGAVKKDWVQIGEMPDEPDQESKQLIVNRSDGTPIVTADINSSVGDK